MEPIDYYTTISEDGLRQIGRLNRANKLTLIGLLVRRLNPNDSLLQYWLPKNLMTEISTQNPNQLLGLIKGLCDDCQITLISK